jgi:hypothetical protein
MRTSYLCTLELVLQILSLGWLLEQPRQLTVGSLIKLRCSTGYEQSILHQLMWNTPKTHLSQIFYTYNLYKKVLHELSYC